MLCVDIPKIKQSAVMVLSRGRILTLEQYFTVMQEAQEESFGAVLNGSFEPAQPKQLSQASTELSLNQT